MNTTLHQAFKKPLYYKYPRYAHPGFPQPPYTSAATSAFTRPPAELCLPPIVGGRYVRSPCLRRRVTALVCRHSPRVMVGHGAPQLAKLVNITPITRG